MEMLHPNPRQPGRGGPCHQVAAPVPLHADRGDGRTYIAADRRRSGETSTHGGLTNGHLKRHLNLHLLDGRDPFAPNTAEMSILQDHRSARSDKMSKGFADMNMTVRRGSIYF